MNAAHFHICPIVLADNRRKRLAPFESVVQFCWKTSRDILGIPLAK